jgi:hypothetical protein
MRRAPTVSQLSRACGFPVPKELARLVACAVDDAPGSEWYDVASALYGRAGFELSGALATALGQREDTHRYSHTPPEFVEFGRLGTDGVSYGFLVLAPELARSDWPQAEFQPMVDEGVGALGDDFRDTVELLTSRALSIRHKRGKVPSAEDKAGLERLAKALSIAPSPRKARWSSHMAYAPNPPVPRGWVHQPAEDGVGVLAPARAFHPWQRQDRRNPWKPLELAPEDLDATLSFARRAVADGYPATALLALNECFHVHWSGWRYPDAARRLRPERQRAYLALGRRAHARALARTPDP